MELGTLLGIILTILIAVVSSRSGKKPNVRRFPPDENQEPQYDFPPFILRDDNQDDSENEAYTLETIPENQYNLESYRPILSSMETPESTYHPMETQTQSHKHKHQPIKAQETEQEYVSVEKFDFDLRKAVIYNEIMNPKFKQY